MTFPDYFSRQSAGYTRFRPRYPRALFEFLAGTVERHERAWDCGTGNGQAAVGLAEWFDEVIATDASAAQLAVAESHPRVRYIRAKAEDCPLASQTVDLVTVAQAVHWFDRPRFYAEVRRVARPGGVLAVWSYGLTTITPAVDRVVTHLYEDLVGPYWPHERHLIEEHYQTIEFPFEELPAPEFAMADEMSYCEIMGYLATWSAVQQFIEHQGSDPLAQIAGPLQSAWGSAQRHTVTRPLFLRVGRIVGSG